MSIYETPQGQRRVIIHAIELTTNDAIRVKGAIHERDFVRTNVEAHIGLGADPPGPNGPEIERLVGRLETVLAAEIARKLGILPVTGEAGEDAE